MAITRIAATKGLESVSFFSDEESKNVLIYVGNVKVTLEVGDQKVAYALANKLNKEVKNLSIDHFTM